MFNLKMNPDGLHLGGRNQYKISLRHSEPRFCCHELSLWARILSNGQTLKKRVI